MRKIKVFEGIVTAAAAILILVPGGCSKRGQTGDRPSAGKTAEEGTIYRSGKGRKARGQELSQGHVHASPAAGRGLGPVADLSPIQLSAEERNLLKIVTAPAEVRPMATDLRIMGKIYAHQFRKAIISYPFPARIARIHVRPGQAVRPGQELITLQSEAVGQAKSEFFKALADHELARSNHEREKRLFDRGAGAGKNLQVAEAELKVAAASLDAAEKKLHVLGFTEAQVKVAMDTHEINPFITLFAPITGKIMVNNAVLGGMVDQSTEILTVLDSSVLCADGEVYERDIARVRPGQDVEVTVPAFPGLVFKGSVQYIGDVFNDATRTVTVRAEVANKDGRLKPGMFANLRLVLDTDERALVVPEKAVIDERGSMIVFVRRGEEFHPRLVKVGARVDGYISIIEGLAEGDEVVIEGGYQLKSKLYAESHEHAETHG